MRSITNLKIRNIKGYGDPGMDRDLEIKTNRVNIIYAPNGAGKSSLATAFKSLKKNKLEVEEEDKYQKNASLNSYISLTEEGTVYVADSSKNEISKELTPVVISSGIEATSKQNNFGGKFTSVKNYIDIKNITIIDTIPEKVSIEYKITDYQKEFGVNGKVLTNLSGIFNSKEFLEVCVENKDSINKFESTSRKNLMNNIISKINALDSSRTAKEIKNLISNSFFTEIENEELYVDILNKFVKFTLGFNKIQQFDFFYQLITFFSHKKDEWTKANKWNDYELFKERLKTEIQLFNNTWKIIELKEEQKTADKKSLIVKFPNADEISNGQRDILTFVVEILKFKSRIKSGKKYLLIRDCREIQKLPQRIDC